MKATAGAPAPRGRALSQLASSSCVGLSAFCSLCYSGQLCVSAFSLDEGHRGSTSTEGQSPVPTERRPPHLPAEARHQRIQVQCFPSGSNTGAVFPPNTGTGMTRFTQTRIYNPNSRFFRSPMESWKSHSCHVLICLLNSKLA